MNDVQQIEMEKPKDHGVAVRTDLPKPPPKREIVYVQRMDLRNRVWTGFLYGVGIWAGAIVGIAMMTMIATIITTVLGVGLAGLASGG